MKQENNYSKNHIIGMLYLQKKKATQDLTFGNILFVREVLRVSHS